MLLIFVFVSLEGSSGDVGAWHEEASSEQLTGKSLKKEEAVEVGMGNHFVLKDEREVSERAG